MQSSAAISKSLDRSHRPLTLPSHLYNRAGIFYFRLVLPEKLRLRLGRVEIRLSLRTAYRRQALDMSRRLYAHFYDTVNKEPMIHYKELRRRLNLYLQYQLEAGYNFVLPRPAIHDCFSPRMDDPDYLHSIAAKIPTDPAAKNPDYSEADLCRYRAEILQAAAKAPESLELWSEFAIQELKKCGLLLHGEIASYDRLNVTRIFLESQVTYYQLLEKRCQGDYLAEDAIVAADFGELPKTLTLAEGCDKTQHTEPEKQALRAAAEAAPQGTEPQQNPEPIFQPKPTPSIRYSEAIKIFVKDKINEGSWQPHMVSENEGRLKVFLEIMGDVELVKITREVMRKYRDILSKLPPHYRKSHEYKGKTIDEILKLAPQRVLSVKRINTLVQDVGSLLGWFVREGVLPSNPAQRLQRREDRQAIELRKPFENRDLEKIFSHPKFALGKFKFADYFWPPLIALFSGMRLEEICQLHCKDVYEIDGVWVFDINRDGLDEKGYGKTLKNINARRLVPVHNTLQDLGFLRYHAHISSTNSIRLFPNLAKGKQGGKYGKQVGKQFNDLLKVVLSAPGFSPNRKAFYSLRHTFSDFYKQRGLQTDTFRQLFGHEIPELAARQYGSKFTPEKLYEVVSVLDYELDLSCLKESRYIKELAENGQSTDS